MKITISFRNKSIVVDDFSCFCDDINKLEPDWISIEIDEKYGVTLYRVGRYESLDDVSFIEPWVEYALNEKAKFEDIVRQQEIEKQENLRIMAVNEQKAEENVEQYQIEYEKYLAAVKQEELVEAQRLENIDKQQNIESLLDNRFKVVTNI